MSYLHLLWSSCGEPETQMFQYKLEPEPAEEVPSGPLEALAACQREELGWLICGTLPRKMGVSFGHKPRWWREELVPSVALSLFLMCGWKKQPEGHST